MVLSETEGVVKRFGQVAKNENKPIVRNKYLLLERNVEGISYGRDDDSYNEIVGDK